MKFHILAAMALILSACAGAPGSGNRAPLDEGLQPDTSRSSAEVQRYVRLGNQAADDNKPDLAAMMYRAAANSAPTDPAPRLAMAQLYERAGNQAAAARLYDELAAKSNDSDKVTLKLAAARAYLKERDYAEASKRYEALTGESGDWRAYNGLGVVRDLQGDEPTASRAYQTALEKAPPESQPKVRANLALSYILGQQPRRAIDLLAPLEKHNALSSTERRYLALAYGFVGRVDEAQRLGLAEPPSYDLLRQSLEAEGGPTVTAAPPTKVTSEPVN